MLYPNARNPPVHCTLENGRQWGAGLLFGGELRWSPAKRQRNRHVACAAVSLWSVCCCFALFFVVVVVLVVVVLFSLGVGWGDGGGWLYPSVRYPSVHCYPGEQRHNGTRTLLFFSCLCLGGWGGGSRGLKWGWGGTPQSVAGG